MKTNIYLPIEIKRRELYARIYFAIHASTKGFRVTIGRKNRFNEFYDKIPSGNFITKSLFRNFDEIKKLRGLGHKIFFLDEEGLMCFNKNFTHRRISKEGLELLDNFFTWGKNHKEDITNLFPEFEKKFYITGNPRFDIIKNKSKEFYSDEIKKIKEIHGNFFLLTTKFGKINYVKRKNVISWYDTQVNKGILRTEETKEVCKRSIKHEEENLKNLFEFIKLFNKSLPSKKLMILVHPAEEISVYANLIKDMTNVKLASDFSTNSWILASDLIIQNNCTTSIEAYIMGVKPIQLNYFKDSEVEFKLPKIVSELFDNNTKLIEYLEKFKKEEFQNTEIYKKNVSLIKEYIENVGDENSVELILKRLSCDKNFQNEFNNLSPSLEKIIYKMKMVKRNLINYVSDKGQLNLAKRKFPYLTFKEVNIFMRKIVEVEGYHQKSFVLKENFPGLFTIEFIKDK